MDAMTTLEKGAQLPTFPRTVRKQMVGFKERLAERIIEAREQRGWDQGELAYRAKVDKKTIQRLEKAQVDRPRPSTMRQLATALEVQVADLRPDMQTEEKNLRAQLDRIDQRVQAIALAVNELLSQPGVDLGPGQGELRRALLGESPTPKAPPAQDTQEPGHG